LENTSPAPIAATIALEMIGPMPGIVIRRSQAGSWATTFAISADRMRYMPIGTDVAHTASVSLIGQYSAGELQLCERRPRRHDHRRDAGGCRRAGRARGAASRETGGSRRHVRLL